MMNMESRVVNFEDLGRLVVLLDDVCDVVLTDRCWPLVQECPLKNYAKEFVSSFHLLCEKLSM